MKKLCSVIVIIISLHGFSNAQEQSAFKSEDFKKDIDYLIDTLLSQAYPKIDVYNSMSNKNILGEMNEKRESLSENISHKEFLKTVSEILRLTHDAHSSIIHGAILNHIIPYYTDDEIERLLKFVDTSSTSVALADRHSNEYRSLNREYLEKMKFWLYVKYINGEYYNILPVKTENDAIETGSIINKVNGVDIHQWVNSNLSRYSTIRFDKKNKRYFTNTFFINDEIINSDTIEITWLTPHNEIKKFGFRVDTNPEVVSNTWITINLATVKYFRKANTLYIRLYSMRDSRKHLKKIRKYGKSKKIERVIIDIRGNGGGNDLVWKEIIEELIDKPITVNLDVATKKSDITMKYFGSEMTADSIDFQGMTLHKLDMRMLETYLPSSTTIGFRDKIIVLFDENIFSSAGSFASIANNSDKFITVGTPCNLPIGVGVTPMFVMLPNTKLLIQFDATIDLTNCKNYTDVYRDVEVPVEITPNTEYIWTTKNFNRWKWSFLSKHDPYLQKALEVDVRKKKRIDK